LRFAEIVVVDGVDDEGQVDGGPLGEAFEDKVEHGCGLSGELDGLGQHLACYCCEDVAYC